MPAPQFFEPPDRRRLSEDVTTIDHPSDRLGVFKRYADVPPAYRVKQYETAYADRNVWQTYLTEYLFKRHNSACSPTDAQRVGSEWKRHMNDCGQHHALARPADVELWCLKLCDT